MAKFNASPLGALDRIYKFVGGFRGLSEVDIETPITRVHDLSRLSDIGSGPTQENGFLFIDALCTHTGAEQIENSVNAFDYLETIYPSLDRRDTRLWVLDSGCYLSSGNFSKVSLSASVPTSFPGATQIGGALSFVPVPLFSASHVEGFTVGGLAKELATAEGGGRRF